MIPSKSPHLPIRSKLTRENGRFSSSARLFFSITWLGVKKSLSFIISVLKNKKTVTPVFYKPRCYRFSGRWNRIWTCDPCQM